MYAGVMDYIAFHPFLRTGSGSLSGPFLLVGVWLKHLLKDFIILLLGSNAGRHIVQVLGDCAKDVYKMGFMSQGK